MADNGVLVNGSRSAEGITTTVPLKGPVKEVLDELMGGLRSAMSYRGARTIAEFHEKALFGVVSQSAQAENEPHITRRSS
jgi:IMP dehydrogenase/GMP reductase